MEAYRVGREDRENELVPPDLRSKINRLRENNPTFCVMQWDETVRQLITLGLDSLGAAE